MTNLLQNKGKKVYYKIKTKRAFDEFVDNCIDCGITNFKSGSPLNKDEYYNHEENCYCHINKDGCVRFVNPNSITGQVINYEPVKAIKEVKVGKVARATEAKEKKAMKFDGLFKGMGFDIVKTDEFGIDLLTGKLAYLSKDKATVIDGKKDLTETLPDMVKSVPLMFLPTPISALKEGDIVKRNNRVGMILSVDGAQIKIQNYSGTISNETIAKNAMFQTSFIPKLFNPFDGFGAVGGEVNPLMALMFADDGGDDGLLSTFMLMQAFGAGQGANPQMQSMLPFLLMKEDGGKDNLMTLLMFSGMMGGQNAGTAGMFGANPMLPLLLAGGEGGIDKTTMLAMTMCGGGNLLGGMFGGQKEPTPTIDPKA